MALAPCAQEVGSDIERTLAMATLRSHGQDIYNIQPEYMLHYIIR